MLHSRCTVIIYKPVVLRAGTSAGAVELEHASKGHIPSQIPSSIYNLWQKICSYLYVNQKNITIGFGRYKLPRYVVLRSIFGFWGAHFVIPPTPGLVEDSTLLTGGHLKNNGIICHIKEVDLPFKSLKKVSTWYHQTFQVPKMEVLTYISCM